MDGTEDLDLDSMGTVLFRVRRLLHLYRYDLLGARCPAKVLRLAGTELGGRPWLMVKERPRTWQLWECGLPSVGVISFRLNNRHRHRALLDSNYNFRWLAWTCDAIDFFSVSLSVIHLQEQFGKSTHTIVSGHRDIAFDSHLSRTFSTL